MPLVLSQPSFEVGEQIGGGRDGGVGILGDDGVPKVLYRLKALANG